MEPEPATSPLESIQREDALKMLDQKLEHALAERESLRCKKIEEKYKIENIKQSDNKGDLTHLPEPKKSRLLEAKKEQDEKIQKQINEHAEILQQIESDLSQLNDQIKQMEQERINLRLTMIDNRELFRISNHKEEFTNEHHELFSGYARGQRNLDFESWREERSPESAQNYKKMMAILEILKPKE
jgi:hypothetical protein